MLVFDPDAYSKSDELSPISKASTECFDYNHTADDCYYYLPDGNQSQLVAFPRPNRCWSLNRTAPLYLK